MDRGRKKMVKKLLRLTLKILLQLTGEDYTVVKKTSSERCQAPVSEGLGTSPSPIIGPPPHVLKHKAINEQKILELTYKMIELLTAEVPVRCQDVAIYFSMEEWEYLEEHKDLYKDVMMEDTQPLTSPVPTYSAALYNSEKTSTDNITHYRVSHNSTQTKRSENPARKLTSYEGIGDSVRSSQKHVISTDFKADDCVITQNTYQQQVIIPAIPSAPYNLYQLCHPVQLVFVPDSLQTVKHIKNDSKNVEHQRIQTGETSHSFSQNTRYVPENRRVVRREKSHTVEKSCSECGKCFKQRSDLIKHQRIHTGEKPYSCSECERSFNQKTHLNRHQYVHTKVKPYSCFKCGTCFSQKSVLERHERCHTGEKPFACLECDKCFIEKAYLVRHQKVHKGK